MPEAWQEGGFGLYVHWPFCQSKCPYCDFNSHVVAQVDQRRWAEALGSEIRRYGAETEGRVLGSIFFGGGTPSLMHESTVEAVITSATETWAIANDLEITLEANPTSVEADRFAGYRSAGVNRVSLGVQALRDEDLRRLGRMHSAAEARSALDIAQRVFGRISIDLIYARQGQTPDDWLSELREAVGLGLDHVSLYQLTVEPGTVFGARHEQGKLPGLPDEDRSVALWDITQAICSENGLAAYEVSNHARTGSECRHNLTYWRSGDWVGVGPGAHGRLSTGRRRVATEAHRQPGRWMEEVGLRGSGESGRVELGASERFEEFLLMGLRLRDGIDLVRLDARERDLIESRIVKLENLGLLARSGSNLCATDQGRLLLNSVISELIGA